MVVRGDVRGWWERAREYGTARPQAVDVGIALLVQAAMTMPFVVPVSVWLNTRHGERTLVYSVNSTDAKGRDMNRVALALMVAAYGAPTG